MNDACPCGCGLTDDAAQAGFYEGDQTFVLLHLAWHRLLDALTLALEYNIDMAIRYGRRARRWLR